MCGIFSKNHKTTEIFHIINPITTSMIRIVTKLVTAYIPCHNLIKTMSLIRLPASRVSHERAVSNVMLFLLIILNEICFNSTFPCWALLSFYVS